MDLESRIAALPERVAAVREEMARAAALAGRKAEEIRLCAVCKGQDAGLIRESALLPVDCFGENRGQEMTRHMAAGAYRDKPCHFIGHLQTNKVKMVAGEVSLIHSVDSERLLKAIQKEAARKGALQDILIQINIGEEESKTGAPKEALWPLIDHAMELPALRLRGLMAIPPAFDNSPVSRGYFAQMRALFEEAKDRLGKDQPFDILSMGMSDSFFAAILEGATLIRVGRGIYGDRA